MAECEACSKNTEDIQALTKRLDDLEKLTLTTAKFIESVDKIVFELDTEFEEKWLYQFGKWETGLLQKLIAFEVEQRQQGDALMSVALTLCEFADEWSGEGRLPLPMSREIKNRVAFILKNESPPIKSGGIDLATVD